MVTKGTKVLVLGAICLSVSHFAWALDGISPEVTQKAGIFGLLVGTNWAGYTAHDILWNQRYSDERDALTWGLRASWLTANLHLFRSLLFPKSISDVTKRGAALVSASLAINTICKYVDNKLSYANGRSVSDSIARGFRLALWTAVPLLNIAILYETLVR